MAIFIGDAFSKNKPISNHPKVHTTFDGEGNPIYHIRKEAIRPNELLYDDKGLPVAINRKGKLLAILKGDL